jgi:hypothetical protein
MKGKEMNGYVARTDKRNAHTITAKKYPPKAEDKCGKVQIPLLYGTSKTPLKMRHYWMMSYEGIGKQVTNGYKT